MAANRSEVRGHPDRRGVGLIETLITALLVTIVVVGLLQFTGHVLFWYERNQLASRDTLVIWNHSRDLRRKRPDSLDTVVAVPGMRPIHRFMLKKQDGGQWEVLCAEK
jgi:Tfp pilus assembly protein PilV